MKKETIYASLTKNQKTAISIIRISGSRVQKISKTFFKRKPVKNNVNIRDIFSLNGDFIDQGIVLLFSKPNSPTGEDVLELQVHGSFSIIKKIEEELEKIKGVREAQPGEFTKRSFYNKKLDLLQVEGLEDLLDSSTDLQRKQAQLLLMGSISSKLNSWRNELIELGTFIETAIDFSDEVIPEKSIKLFYLKLENLISQITNAVEKAKYSQKVREGVKVIVTGPPNAGKSSLINCLLDENLSIVSEEPGTTRDIVSSTVDIDGILVNIYDTAGIHDATDPVEIEGIRRAKELLKISDIQIKIVDGKEDNCYESLNDIPSINQLTINLINKSDLVERNDKKRLGFINISTKSSHNMIEFRKILKEYIKQVVNKGQEPIILRDRHLKISIMLLESLKRIKSNDIQFLTELVAEDIRHSLVLIGKITGSVGVEDILDNLFKNFCIGK
tara:strand:- start:460 stop:1791 length:1332 start_codon:yes stop_codon:yes gene_type:complete